MKDHNVEYRSMDHYMKSEEAQKRSQKMADMGVSTCATPKSTNEEVQTEEQARRGMYISLYRG